MLETIFILLLIFAILLIILAIEYHDNPYWELVFIVLDIPLWFILALSNMQIERPWEMYNVSSNQIETGIHIVSSPVSPYLTYFFMGIGLVMMIYMIVVIWGSFYEKSWRK